MLSMIVMKVEQSGKYTNHLKTLMFYVDASSLCLLQGKLTGFQTRVCMEKNRRKAKFREEKVKFTKKQRKNMEICQRNRRNTQTDLITGHSGGTQWKTCNWNIRIHH